MAVTKSDIDQLILGHISEEKYIRTRNNLFEESPNLPAKVPILDMFGNIASEHRLQTILDEYVQMKLQNEGRMSCPTSFEFSSLPDLWDAFDRIVALIKIFICNNIFPQDSKPAQTEMRSFSPTSVSTSAEARRCLNMSANVQSSSLRIRPPATYGPFGEVQKKQINPVSSKYEDAPRLKCGKITAAISDKPDEKRCGRRKKVSVPRHINPEQKSTSEPYAHNGDLSKLLNFNGNSGALALVGAKIMKNMKKCAEKRQNSDFETPVKQSIGSSDVACVGPAMPSLDVDYLMTEEQRENLVEMTIDSLLASSGLEVGDKPLSGQEEVDPDLLELKKLMDFDFTDASFFGTDQDLPSISALTENTFVDNQPFSLTCHLPNKVQGICEPSESYGVPLLNEENAVTPCSATVDKTKQKTTGLEREAGRQEGDVGEGSCEHGSTDLSSSTKIIACVGETGSEMLDDNMDSLVPPQTLQGDFRGSKTVPPKKRFLAKDCQNPQNSELTKTIEIDQIENYSDFGRNSVNEGASSPADLCISCYSKVDSECEASSAKNNKVVEKDKIVRPEGHKDTGEQLNNMETDLTAEVKSFEGENTLIPTEKKKRVDPPSTAEPPQCSEVNIQSLSPNLCTSNSTESVSQTASTSQINTSASSNVHVMSAGAGPVVITLKNRGRMPIHVQGIVVQPGKADKTTTKNIIDTLVNQIQPMPATQNSHEGKKSVAVLEAPHIVGQNGCISSTVPIGQLSNGSAMNFDLANEKLTLEMLNTPRKVNCMGRFSTISPSSGIFSVIENTLEKRAQPTTVSSGRLATAKVNLFSSSNDQEMDSNKRSLHVSSHSPDSTSPSSAKADLVSANEGNIEPNKLGLSSEIYKTVTRQDHSFRRRPNILGKKRTKNRTAIGYNAKPAGKMGKRPSNGLYLCNDTNNMIKIKPKKYELPGLRKYYIYSNCNSGDIRTEADVTDTHTESTAVNGKGMVIAKSIFENRNEPVWPGNAVSISTNGIDKEKQANHQLDSDSNQNVTNVACSEDHFMPDVGELSRNSKSSDPPTELVKQKEKLSADELVIDTDSGGELNQCSNKTIEKRVGLICNPVKWVPKKDPHCTSVECKISSEEKHLDKSGQDKKKCPETLVDCNSLPEDKLDNSALEKGLSSPVPEKTSDTYLNKLEKKQKSQKRKKERARSNEKIKVRKKSLRSPIMLWSTEKIQAKLNLIYEGTEKPKPETKACKQKHDVASEEPQKMVDASTPDDSTDRGNKLSNQIFESTQHANSKKIAEDSKKSAVSTKNVNSKTTDTTSGLNSSARFSSGNFADARESTRTHLVNKQKMSARKPPRRVLLTPVRMDEPLGHETSEEADRVGINTETAGESVWRKEAYSFEKKEESLTRTHSQISSNGTEDVSEIKIRRNINSDQKPEPVDGHKLDNLKIDDRTLNRETDEKNMDSQKITHGEDVKNKLGNGSNVGSERAGDTKGFKSEGACKKTNKNDHACFCDENRVSKSSKQRAKHKKSRKVNLKKLDISKFLASLDYENLPQ